MPWLDVPLSVGLQEQQILITVTNISPFAFPKKLGLANQSCVLDFLGGKGNKQEIPKEEDK